MVTLLLGIFLLAMLVVTAIGIVRARNLFAAVMLSSIYSLLMAVNFFLLDAADVALTEAAVGAGIATVLQLSALALLPNEETDRPGLRWFALVVVVVNAGILLYATLDQPTLGDPSAPVHQHVAPWYFTQNDAQIQVPNVVTAVLGAFRAYDTLGEVFVVLTAGLGVFFLLGLPERDETQDNPRFDLRHHLVPEVIGRLLIPFIVLFGLYVQFHGDYGPGGGFQAGALVAAAFILHAITQGERAALRVMPPAAMLWLSAAGALLYGGVGVATLLAGGNFLEYGVLGEDPVAAQHWGLLLIELGVGITVTGVLLGIFHAFAGRSL